MLRGRVSERASEKMFLSTYFSSTNFDFKLSYFQILIFWHTSSWEFNDFSTYRCRNTSHHSAVSFVLACALVACMELPSDPHGDS